MAIVAIPKKTIPEDIKDLLTARDMLRNSGKYQEADVVRKTIEEKGYVLRDTTGGARLYRITPSKSNQTFVVLFGSGEISPSGQQIHDVVLKQMGNNHVRIAIVSTPAGFQPNVQTVYREYADFFYKRLKNYHPQISLIFANNKDQANDPSIVKPVKQADYIVTGAGSPTYAIEHLENTLLLSEMITRVTTNHASLALSSAATIAFSHLALPVYEIYKVGEPLHWKKGLNAYHALLGKQVTVIPHFNNKEGGKKLDTSYCYMGKERFIKLRSLFPPNEIVWGIDEHTGIVIDVKTKQSTTLGKGRLHKIKMAS